MNKTSHGLTLGIFLDHDALHLVRDLQCLSGDQPLNENENRLRLSFGIHKGINYTDASIKV